MPDLQSAIANETVDTLKKKYTTYFGVKPKLTRKAELTKALTEGFSDQAMLKAYLKKLSELEVKLLRESVFNYDGYIDRARFKLKYGEFPDQKATNSWFFYDRGPTDEVAVFFLTEGNHWNQIQRIPQALIRFFRELFDQPEPNQLKVTALPEALPDTQKLVERERLAVSELHSLLILLQDKQLKVSDKTGVASGATLKKVAKDVHEYYNDVVCDEAKGMDSILSYGWLRMLGNSKFAKQSGSILVNAKKTGRNPAETIREIWEQWVNNKKEDEFRRIDRIKGQNGKGKRFFTDVVERRKVVAEYLKDCQPGEWIAVDDFSDFLFITAADLQISAAPHSLYLYSPEQGEFDGGNWKILESRYLRCLLVEYIATLGMIDVVMSSPENEDATYDEFGDEACLSRYDGLRYFRLTTLGQFVLGLTKSYTAETTNDNETPLTIQRQGRIAFDCEPTPWEQRFLSLYADHAKENVWKLSRKKIMETLQIGGSIEELKAFLEARDDQPFLPEDCESILKQSAANLDGARIKEEALIVACKNEEVVEFIMNDKQLSKWCQRLGKLQVVIPKNKEKKFKESLNSVGIGCSG